MDKKAFRMFLNLMIMAGIFIFACALVAILKGMYSEKSEAANQQIETEAQLEIEEDEYNKGIPGVILGPGEDPVPLGVEAPPVEEMWENKEPLFFYKPEQVYLWDCTVYKVIGGTGYHFLIKVKNYTMEVTFWGLTGSVWKYTTYQNGELVGVTDHHFIVKENGQVLAIIQETDNSGRTVSFEELEEDEKASLKTLETMGIEFGNNIQVNSWNDEFVQLEFSEDSVNVKLDWTVLKMEEKVSLVEKEKRTWYKYNDGRLFFVQDLEPLKEAVFVGGINGFPSVFHMYFEGEFVKADSRGIYYIRDGVMYFKSFIPVYYETSSKKYDASYLEVPAELLEYIEYPQELQGGNDASYPVEDGLF